MKIVFDIGGTSMRAARVEGDAIEGIKKVDTPDAPEAGVETLVRLARELAGGEAVDAIAGGIPGIVSEDGTVHLAPNLPQWNGLAFGKKLSEALGVPAIVRNDADCAALGEAVYGAGVGAHIVAYIGVGTGVGGGRIVGGQIDSAAFGFEPGHQVLGLEECASLEDIVSGSAFIERYQTHPAEVPYAEYKAFAPILAIGLYNTIAHWSPDALVLGGSMMNEENGYRLADIAQALESLPQRFPLPQIRLAALRDTAGLEGARALLAAQ